MTTHARSLFYSAAAQDDNLGDVVIRRQVLHWAAERPETLCVFVGPMSRGFVEALDIPMEVELIRERSAYLARWFAACRRRRPKLVLPPGPRPVSSNIAATAAALRNWTMTCTTRAAGGTVVAVGAALVGTAKSLAGNLYRWSASASQHFSVRDPLSLAMLDGRGTLIPDVAFADARPEVSGPGDPVFVISLRNLPDSDSSARSLTSLVSQARRVGMMPIVVTQVRRDDPGHRRLRDELGVCLLDWPADTSHRAQEERLQQIYQRAAVVHTDRLHVAILAARHGAGVIDASASTAGKVTRTLGHVLETIHRPDEAVDLTMETLATQRERVVRRVELAASRLSVEREAVRESLLPSPVRGMCFPTSER